MENFKTKELTFEDLAGFRQKNHGKKIVFTNGCFDILHVGHMRCLRQAREYGDLLVVGINSDASVKRLKGETRPINGLCERAEMLAAYPFVDYVVAFEEDTPANIIRALRPDVWVKGGDYTLANLPGKELCGELGIDMKFVPLTPGKSTTNILKASFDVGKNRKKAAVIGDIALDFSYFTRKSTELSAETRMPVDYVEKIGYDAGGAGNLAVNLSTLGIDTDVYGFCGTDIWSEMLGQKMSGAGVNCRYMISCAEAQTYVYHRVFDANGNEVIRYDIGPGNVYSDKHGEMLLNSVAENVSKYDCIVINQQLSSGIYSEKLIAGLGRLLDGISVPVWMDCRTEPFIKNCSYKINLSEAKRYTGKTLPEDCAAEIHRRFISSPGKYVVITLGENGAVAFDGDRYYHAEKLKSDWTKDAVGAGDAFLAALCSCMLNGNGMDNALIYASAAGTVSTKYRYECGHPTSGEITELLRDNGYTESGRR